MASPEKATSLPDGEKKPVAPSISLPKGGGAIRSMGEKFAANPVTGTGSMTVPIATSPGRTGFGPQLSLSYDSGSGNGPFGFGWSQSIPQISRKTDKGLPRYLDAEESDVFLLSGVEDLVPLLDPEGNRFEDRVSQPGYTIHRYRPRIEGLFARIERWTDQATGAIHWRSISRDNVTTLYGKTDNSRIADPADPSHIFIWLTCESYDDKGNAIAYEYKVENSQGVDLSQAHEWNRDDTTRARAATRYLKHIRYGNQTPYYPRLEPDAAQTSLPSDWLFEVVFDYGEHDLDAPTPDDVGAWSCRVDPFSSYRAGFEVRTYRLCQRVLMFHHFVSEPGVGTNCLVRSTDFTYSREVQPDDRHDPIYSFLLSATQAGYTRREEGGYLKKSLPPLAFEYTQPVIESDIHEVNPESLENLPSGLDYGRYQWLDLDGEGLSSILTEQAEGWFYKRNLSPINLQGESGRQSVSACFGPLERVAERPSSAAMASGRQQLLDLAGDGQLDLVDLAGPVQGFYERSLDERWEPFVPFMSLPALDWSDPNLKFIDLTGDGHADVLITEDDAFCWHPSLAEAGFGPAERVCQPLDEAQGPRMVFADGTQSVYLADMSGDGLTDLVRIRNGEVSYWPNLGYGRFGAKVTMDGAPWFDTPDQFDQRRIRLADIDGSGTVDIIYLGRDGVQLYFNQSGNAWGEAQQLAAFPAVDDLSAVQVVDLLGNGTACLVWSSALPGDTYRPMRYLNLVGAQKPHLLVKTINNLGAETHVTYAPSTRFYLADKLAGRPWITRIPFPVHVVERVETVDRISGNRFVTRYSYHHGYFDGVEREFRGFGMVEQWDSEEFAALSESQTIPRGTNIEESSHVPPMLTRTWFHTGVYLGREQVSNYFAGLLDGKDIGEYFREPGLSDEEAKQLLLDDTLLPDGLTIEEEREACRALKGVMLRQEVYALDGTEKEAYPYTLSEQNFTIRLLQPIDGNRHAVFFTHAREAISYHYERNPADPRIAHALTLEVDDFSNVLKSAAVGYGRRRPDLSLSLEDREKQAQVSVTLTENGFTNPIDLANDYRTPLPAESRDYELTGLALAASQNRFSLDEILNATATVATLTYEQTPAPGTLQKRLIERVRTLYRQDDLAALLPLGKVELLALPGESYKLAFTPGLVDGVYGGKVTETILEEEGRYVHSEGDLSWWIPSGRVFFSPIPDDDPPAELAFARQHFFLPHRFRDPFHRANFATESFVTYDVYNLLPRQTRDALGNTVGAANDYRVLQPFLLTDPNGNQTAAAFDALGMVAGTAVMGKPGDPSESGDTLEEFIPDLPDEMIAAHLENPLIDPHAILGRAATRLVYDLFSYQLTQDQPQPAPSVVYTLARETHQADLEAGSLTKIQHSFSYSDGFGREIQKKLQAEPGPLAERGPDVSPRWVGSGWTLFNNKGKPVRQFEPFFTGTHHFEFDVRIGVSPVLFYDPLGRVVATLHPNHTWQKVVFDPWRQETWDVNDTVLIDDPKTDPNVGDFFARLPDDDYLPTWHRPRIAGALGPENQTAAGKAAAHADTPSIVHLDSLARAFLTIAHNRVTSENGQVTDAFYRSMIVYDIEGNQREVVDALERAVMRYGYDMLSSQVHSISMDAGERWMLNDVAGKPIRSWDARGHAFRATYDRLHRPTGQYVIGGDPAESDPRVLGREVLFGKVEYGEGQTDDAALNLRAKVFKNYDTGIVTNQAYDFKGNLLRGTRQLAADYKGVSDWAGVVELAADVFLRSAVFDALNRPISLTAPDNSEIKPTYNEANLLEQVQARLRGTAEWTPFVLDLDYNAKGQRERIEYGNGVSTSYAYDPLTFRLIHLRTLRGIDRLQDLSYTYDPAGNITHIEDDAQQTLFFANTVVEPRADYTYDAIYQLITTTGREHIGQTGQVDHSDPPIQPLPHPNNGQAMRPYTEIYQYDAVGNILAMIHQANGGNWTRHYQYAVDSNRLLATSLPGDDPSGPFTGPYEYNTHGSMTRMPHLPVMAWDFTERLQASSGQVVNAGSPETTYYVFDAAGQRVRKVTERQAAEGEMPTRKNERIYFGGFEIYREYNDDGMTVTLERETLHIMDDKQRIALAETRTQGDDGLAALLIRYQLGNYLGSVSAELDGVGQLISYEEYFPYGGASYQATDASIRMAAKRYRYTGIERDEETGFAYHGVRYYAAWLGRWCSSDPALLSDGNNVYSYSRNNPTKYMDREGSSASEAFLSGLDAGLRFYVADTILSLPETTKSVGKLMGMMNPSLQPATELAGNVAGEFQSWAMEQSGLTGFLKEQQKVAAIEYGTANKEHPIATNIGMAAGVTTGVLAEMAVTAPAFGEGVIARESGELTSNASRVISKVGTLASRRPGSASFTGVARFDTLFVESPYFTAFSEGLQRRGFSVVQEALPGTTRAETRVVETVAHAENGLSYSFSGAVVYDPAKTTYLDMLHEARHVHQYLAARQTSLFSGRAGFFFEERFSPLLERGAYEYELRLGKAFGFNQGSVSAIEGLIAEEGWTVSYEKKFFDLTQRSLARKMQSIVEPNLGPRYGPDDFLRY